MKATGNKYDIFLSENKCHKLHFQVQCDEDEYELDCHLYNLDYRIIDGDVSLPENSFKGTDFLPNGELILFLMLQKDGKLDTPVKLSADSNEMI